VDCTGSMAMTGKKACHFEKTDFCNMSNLRNLSNLGNLSNEKWPVEKAEVTAIGADFRVCPYVVAGVFLCYRCYRLLARAREDI
jgi:hypothetical protein